MSWQKIVDSLLTHNIYVLITFSNQIRRYVGPANRPLWHYGLAGDLVLFLSEIHVLVPAFDVCGCSLPLVLFTHVRGWNLRRGLAGSSILCCHYSTILQGKTSHKFIDMNENPIMHIYYTNRTVLGFMCLFNELFYAALYLLYFTSGPIGKPINEFPLKTCTN